MAGVDVLTAVSIVLAGCVLSLRRATDPLWDAFRECLR